VSNAPAVAAGLACLAWILCTWLASAQADRTGPAPNVPTPAKLSDKPPAAIPPHNRADQSQPPPRPPANEVETKIRQLFDAIVADDPKLAALAFFPRDAFLLVKDMANPGRYYDQLRRRFDADIHVLHAQFPGIENAVFERFELAQRGGFVAPHAEGNRLPYWASRHSRVYFRIGKARQTLEVRVLITWDDRWYVIHLNEFH
jgi:hypothetical protein